MNFCLDSKIANRPKLVKFSWIYWFNHKYYNIDEQRIKQWPTIKAYKHGNTLDIPNIIFGFIWNEVDTLFSMSNPLYEKLKGLSLNQCNYRPISILPSFSKSLEKIASLQLFRYLEIRSMLCNEQYRFRAHRSTKLNCQNTIRDIYRSFD